MKIEVGQWVRFINSDCEQEILQIKKFNDYIYINPLGIDEGKIIVLLENLLIKVADTPQELIQVGDLVESTKNYLFRVFTIHENNMLDGPSRLRYVCYKDITKIYTPNEDKSQYTLQWSIEV